MPQISRSGARSFKREITFAACKSAEGSQTEMNKDFLAAPGPDAEAGDGGGDELKTLFLCA